jgi:hypothetical protein
VSEVSRRYTFQPLERRGLLLGLQAGQIGTLIGGVAGALVAGHVVAAPVGPGVAVLVLVAAAVGALWPHEGRPLTGWIPVVARWAGRRSRGPVVGTEPLAGWRGRGLPIRVGATSPGPDRGRTGPAPAGIDLVEVPGLPGQDALGVVRDRRSASWAAVVPVQGRSFVLLDVDEQLRRLESWRAVLGTLARPSTPLRRIQWVHRSAPVCGGGVVALPPGDASTEAARDSYRQLVAGSGAVTQSHQAWMVLAVGGSHRPGGQEDRVLDGLRREVRLLDGHLRNSDLRAGAPLGLEAMRGLLGSAQRPDLVDVAGDAPRAHPWPMATDEAWSALRADGTWHATYWISEWPRVEVSPDFMTPLLLCDGRRTVSVVMAPVPADRAAREVRAARAADVADEELRSRAGFLPSARRRREADGVVRREAELADGHAEFRFSGYVTVTAPDRAALETACVETEQAAQTAHLELRRLYGRQAEAYTWTLPLARGLA